MSNELLVPVPDGFSNFVDPNTKFLRDPIKPVLFTLGPVVKKDGNKLLIYEVEKAGYYIYREEQTSTAKIWDKKIEDWGVPVEVAEKDRELNPLEYVEDNPEKPWKGRVLFMGEEKKFKNTDIATGYPQYFIGCYFEHKISEEIIHKGESDRSPAIKLPKAGKDIKAGIETDKQDNPNLAKYFIKNGSNTHSAWVELKKNGNITIDNRKAQVVVKNNGDIELSPSSGGRVIIKGNLEVNAPSGYIKFNGVKIHY